MPKEWAYRIYAGNGALLRMSDHIYVGLKDGSQGELIIEDGAVLEYSEQYVGAGSANTNGTLDLSIITLHPTPPLLFSIISLLSCFFRI